MGKHDTKTRRWGLICLVLALVLAGVGLGIHYTLKSGEDEAPAVQSQQPQASEAVPAESDTPAESAAPVETPEVSQAPEETAAPVEPSAPAESAIPAEPAVPASELQQIVEDLRAAHSGNWDIRVEALDGSRLAATTTVPGQPMVSASIIKLFIMATVYHYIDQGILSHDQCYQLIYNMITVSDNWSTNELIRLLGGGDAAAGMAVVNSYAAQLGCTGTTLNRLMLAGNGLENYTTAADCALVLRMIYEGRCVSGDWSAEMLSVLKQQTVNNRLPAGLPGVTCAHKTGDLTGLCCADVGIVFAPGGDYIICAICNYPNNDYNAAQAIVSLSAAVYQSVNA